MIVGQDLHLDVTRVLQVPLQVDVGAAERALRRTPAGFKRRWKIAGPHRHPHPDATPAGGGLHHYRVADAFRLANRGSFVGKRGRPRHDGNPGFDHAAAGLDFIAHGPHAGRRRTDEGQPLLGTGLRERRVL